MPEHAECLLIEFGFQGTAITGPLVAQDLESRPLHLFEWSVNLRKSFLQVRRHFRISSQPYVDIRPSVVYTPPPPPLQT